MNVIISLYYIRARAHNSMPIISVYFLFTKKLSKYCKHIYKLYMNIYEFLKILQIRNLRSSSTNVKLTLISINFNLFFVF